MRSTIFKSLVILFVLTIAISALAADSTNLLLASGGKVSGKDLAPGKYKVSWTGTGNNVDVTFANGANVVKAKAKFVDVKKKLSYTAASTENGVIKMLYISGKNQALDFAE